VPLSDRAFFVHLVYRPSLRYLHGVEMSELDDQIKAIADELANDPQLKTEMYAEWLKGTANVLNDLVEERCHQFDKGYTPEIDMRLNTSPHIWMAYMQAQMTRWMKPGFPNLNEKIDDIRSAFLKTAAVAVAACEFIDRFKRMNTPPDPEQKDIRVYNIEDPEDFERFLKDMEIDCPGATDDPQGLFEFLKGKV